ncbi:MAG: hydrogenase maturation nickel metallochaperone HypA [candidate division WOR-3 bacterium]
MHEVSVCESLLDVVEETAKKHGAKSVCLVKVRIGEISGVVPELLEHAFEVLAPERSITRRAKLLIERVKPSAVCDACGKEFTPEDYIFICPGCGSGRTRLLEGDELILERIRMEV